MFMTLTYPAREITTRKKERWKRPRRCLLFGRGLRHAGQRRHLPQREVRATADSRETAFTTMLGIARLHNLALTG
jgi:hypothetical protein